MEYPQNLNSLQAWTNPVRYDIACFWNDKFAGARQPTGMTQRRIIAQQGNSVVNVLHYKPDRLQVIFSNVFCFLIQVFQRLV